MLGAAESGGQALQSTLKRWFIDGMHVGRIDTIPRITALPEMWYPCSGLLSQVCLRVDHQTDSSSQRRPHSTLCMVLCFVGLMLPPGWHHYFAFLPFVQLQLLQHRPSKTVLGLLILAMATERIPILALGLSEHSYAVASSLGCTTLCTLLSWLAWLIYLSSRKPISDWSPNRYSVSIDCRHSFVEIHVQILFLSL